MSAFPPPAQANPELESELRATLLFAMLREFRLAWDADDRERAQELFWWLVNQLFDPEVYYAHPWAHLSTRAFLKWKRTGLLGAKSSSKSATAVLFMLVAWWAYFPDAQCTYITTTLDVAKLRGWSMLTRLLENAQQKFPDLPGHLVRTNPPKITQSKESNDDLHAIICRPLPENAESIYKSFKGQHARRLQIIVLDEINEFPLDDVPEALEGALDLPYKIFRLISCQNPRSYDDPGGLEVAPVDVTWEDIKKNNLEVWRTKGGVALRFDATRSPNILSGRNIYPHLPTPETVANDLERVGGDLDHPTVLMFTRALPCPEGSAQTVLSRVLVREAAADEPADWTGFGDIRFYAAMDPAFRANGDEAICLVAQVGRRPDGFWQVEFQQHHKTIIPAEEERTSHYWIVEWTMPICRAAKVPHVNLGVDVSGPGMGLGPIFERLWGPVHGVNYGGLPTKDPISVRDQRRWADVVDRKCTEILIRLQFAIQLGHVKGLSGVFDKIVTQGMARPVYIQGGKLSAVRKKDVTRQKRWQDHLDGASCLLDLLNAHGYKLAEGVVGAPDIREATRKAFEDSVGEKLDALREVQRHALNPMEIPSYAKRPSGFGTAAIDYSDPLSKFRIGK